MGAGFVLGEVEVVSGVALEGETGPVDVGMSCGAVVGSVVIRGAVTGGAVTGASAVRGAVVGGAIVGCGVVDATLTMLTCSPLAVAHCHW